MKRPVFIIFMLLNIALVSSLACGSASIPDLPTSDWRGPHGETEYEYVPRQGYIDGADGEPIYLINNPQSHNPSWEELTDFLQEDDTDKYVYDESSFITSDSAEILHNNAESAGVRAAFVSIEFEDGRRRQFNAFNTSDRGLVYIDASSSTSVIHCSTETILIVELNKEYIFELVFPCTNVRLTSNKSSRIVSAIYIQW